MTSLALFLTFFRIGCTGFGGLGSVLAQLERELVTKQHRLTTEDMTEALTYTKLLPGSTVVQVVSFLGWRLGKWRGSALATLAFVLPAFGVMLVLAVFYAQITTLPNVQGALRGLNAVVIGLLVVTAYKLGNSAIKDWLSLIIAIAALGLAVLVNAPFVAIVVGAGGLGLLVYALEARKV